MMRQLKEGALVFLVGQLVGWAIVGVILWVALMTGDLHP